METFTRPREAEARIKYREERTAARAETAAHIRAAMIANGTLRPLGIAAQPHVLANADPVFVKAARKTHAEDPELAQYLRDHGMGQFADLLRELAAREARK